MLEDVRRNVFGFVEAGMAAVSGALTPARAREMARSLASGEGPKQANRIAQELLEWSQRSREWISEAVSREVKRQLATMGIATKEDLDALRKRVRELERSGGGKSAGARKSSAKKPGGARKSSEKAASSRKGSATVAPGLGGPGPANP
jgi:polyhydroxyalkanoate synthesis regulator phasin